MQATSATEAARRSRCRPSGRRPAAARRGPGPARLRRERTRRAYAHRSAAVRRLGGGAGARRRAEVGPKAVRRYIAHLSERGAAPSTSARKLAALRALLLEPARARRSRPEPRRPRLHAAPRRSSTARAHRARGLASAGRHPHGRAGRWSCATGRCSSWPTRAGCVPRRSCRCATADVDHDGEQLRVEGKGRKTRFVPVGEPAMAAVRPIWSARGERCVRGGAP